MTASETPSVLASPFHRRFGSTGVLWLILLSVLCAGVAILGISRIARQEPSAAEPIAEASPEEPPAAESAAPELIDKPMIEDGIDTRNTETAVTQEPDADDRLAPDAEPEGDTAGMPTSARPQARRLERRGTEPSAANERETRSSVDRDIAPPDAAFPATQHES